MVRAPLKWRPYIKGVIGRPRWDSGLSEFAFQVGVLGVFSMAQQAVVSSEEVILWASLRGCGR